MKNSHHGGKRPAFSYPVKVGHISVNPVTVHLEADAAELTELARLWGVVEVKSLDADLQMTRWKKDGVRLKGKVNARIVQSCVVTLDPVESQIEEELDQIFVPEGSKLARIVANDVAEMVLDPEGPDSPETFVGDSIDAGAVVSEFAALAIDPYPRKQGVEFVDHLESDAEQPSARPNPFAVLKDWKKD